MHAESASREAKYDSGARKDLSAGQVAEVLRVSVRTVYRQLYLFLETNGREGLRGYKVGKLWRVPEDALTEYRARSPKAIPRQPSRRAVCQAQPRESTESSANPLAIYMRGKGGGIISDLATVMAELGVDGPTLNQWIMELMKAGLLRQTGFMWELVEDVNPMSIQGDKDNGH